MLPLKNINSVKGIPMERQSVDQSMKMVIPGSSAYQVLKVEDIVRCEGLQNYCRVFLESGDIVISTCLLYTSPSPRDQRGSRMPSSA